MLWRKPTDSSLRQGGVLTGREERYDFFEGKLRPIDLSPRNQQLTLHAGEPKSSGGVLGDNQSNPYPRDLRTVGHEERMHHEYVH